MSETNFKFHRSLVHKKNNFCKNLAKFSQSIQLLQTSNKKYKSCKIGEFGSNSCKLFATILQNFFNSCKIFARVVLLESCKKCIFVKILQDLARNKLSVYTLRSDNLCISPKSKYNQPLKVKFDELYTC